MRRRFPIILMISWLFLSAAFPVAAQQGPVYLQPGHWSWDAVRRLNILGIAPASSDPMLAPVTLQHARNVFATAADSAQRLGMSEEARTAAAYLQLLERLHGEPEDLRIAVGAGYAHLTGELLAAEYSVRDSVIRPPRPLPDLSGPLLSLDASGGYGRFGWQIAGATIGDDAILPVALVSAALGPFDVWAGRQRIHYGAGRSGGVVAGTGWDADPVAIHRAMAPITGAGFAVRDPFHFPGFLRFLGPDRIEIVAGRLDRVGDIDDPYIVVGRLIGTPFSRRFTLGLNRGAIFGGDGKPVTLRRLIGVAFGEFGGEDAGVRSSFENQVISGLVRWRPPVEDVVPLELFLEWGADDMAGAIYDNPGMVMGIDVAALPGLPSVSASLEHAQLSAGIPDNFREWYINYPYGGSYTDAGRLIAHPLGGIGRQWQLRTALELPARGLIASATLLHRRRYSTNILRPPRAGTSRGVTGSLFYAGPHDLGVRLFGSVEDGDGWREQRLTLRGEYRF